MLAKINKERYFGVSQENDRHGLWSLLYIGPSPLSVHFSMFFKTIEFLGSEKQATELIPQIKKMQVIGCYAQTELGHGSNVAGLETTATLDKFTDEWVINTPTIRATKFWPGTLGLMANHAVVYARCIVGD